MNRQVVLGAALVVAVLGSLASGERASAGDWYWTGSGEVLLRDYSDAPRLDSLVGFGVQLDGDYLERGGFVLGYNYNQRSYKPASVEAVDRVDENIAFAGGHLSFFPDALPGSLTLRLDGYLGRDSIRVRTPPSGGGMGGGQPAGSYTIDDDITVLAPNLSFLNFAKTLYLDLGYAFSSYRASDATVQDIDVRQWTPTIGLGFNEARDWLQLRGYLIDLSNSNRVAGQDATSAIEAKWTHWYGADAWLGLHSTQLTLLGGERLLAVDGDAHAIYSVADLQTGSVALALEWELGEQSALFLQGAWEQYRNLTLDDDYASPYFYLYLSRKW